MPTCLTFSLFIFSESNFYLVSFFFTLKNFFKISYNVGSLKFSLLLSIWKTIHFALIFKEYFPLYRNQSWQFTLSTVRNCFIIFWLALFLTGSLHSFLPLFPYNHVSFFPLMILRFSLYHWFSAIWCALVCCSYVSYDTCALLSFLVMWVYYFHQIWKKGHFFFQIIFTVYLLPPSRFQLHIGRQLHSILQVTVTLFMDFKIFPPLCISFFNNFHSCNFRFTDHYYALSNMLLNL